MKYTEIPIILGIAVKKPLIGYINYNPYRVYIAYRDTRSSASKPINKYKPFKKFNMTFKLSVKESRLFPKILGLR